MPIRKLPEDTGKILGNLAGVTVGILLAPATGGVSGLGVLATGGGGLIAGGVLGKKLQKRFEKSRRYKHFKKKK